MGILTDFFIASDAEIATSSFMDAGPAELFPALEAKNIDTVPLAILSAILDGTNPDTLDFRHLALANDENIVRDLGAELGGAEYEYFILRLPAKLVAQLANLTREEIIRYGLAWADSFWSDTRPPSAATRLSAVEFLGKLRQFAMLALDQDKTLFLSICI